MTCSWQLGVMTLMECGEPAMGACTMCGCPLCGKHMVMSMAGAAGCPRCASTNAGFPKTDLTEMASARETYYQPFGGTRGFGSSSYFSDEDEEAMRRGKLGAVAGKSLQDRDYDALET
jgi:hypothetical protein